MWVESFEGFRLSSTSYLFFNRTIQVIRPNLSEIGNSFSANALRFLNKKWASKFLPCETHRGARIRHVGFDSYRNYSLWVSIKFGKKTWDNWQSNGISPPLCRHGSYVNSRISSRQNVNQCILIPIKHLWGDYISKEDSTIKQISR